MNRQRFLQTLYNLMTITLLALGAAVLAGCQGSRGGTTGGVDDGMTQAYQDLNAQRIELVKESFASCAVDPLELKACTTDLCRVILRQEAGKCQASVVDAAGKVALELPKRRESAWSVAWKELGATVRGIAPIYAGYRQTAAGFDLAGILGRGALEAASDLGRPNVDNSTTTTTTTTGSHNSDSSTSAGDGSVIGSGQIGSNTQTEINGQVGDNDASRSCTGDDCRIDSPGENADDQDNSDNLPPEPDGPVIGAADGFCPTFADPALDPDC